MVTKELCLLCTFCISGGHILAPVLKYILASAVSSYDFPGRPDKYFLESLYIMFCYFPEWMGVFMNSRI